MSKNSYSIDGLRTGLEKELGHKLSPVNLQALKLAFQGHTNQYRETNNDQKLPYIVHPVGVSTIVVRNYPIVKKYLKDDLDTLINVALTHDLLEDTRITGDQLEEMFGAQTRRLVEAMTKLPSPNANPEKRQQELIGRIVSAGPSAVYAKVCDVMHNLSWPKLTPTVLLMRTINRGRKMYVPMLDKVKFGKELKPILLEKIEAAENYIAEQNPKSIINKKVPQNIGEAINACATLTQRKVLEVHDIVDALVSIAGADSVSAWAARFENRAVFQPILMSGKEEEFVESIPESQIKFSAQELQTAAAAKFFKHVSPDGKYFMLTLRVSINYRYLVLITFDNGIVPEWVTITNLEFLMDSLSERLIVANADYKKTLAQTASLLGMRFEVDWADILPIEPSNLIELQKWQRRCAQAIRQVVHTCELFFEREAQLYPLKDLVRIESRVKETSSIVRKFLPPSHYEWPKFARLEDVAGVRVICPTKKLVNNLKKYLSSAEVRHHGISLHPGYQVRDYTKNPTLKGYRALHLVLFVETYLQKKRVQVPCEIQLQTMIQDVWAKISRQVVYQHGHSADAIGRQLREVGESLDRFDALVETITDQKPGKDK